MKHFLVFLFLTASPFFALSQKLGKFFYTKKWELTTRDSAAFIRMSIYDTSTAFFAGPFTDMYLSGKPQMKGAYRLKEKEGEFTSFYENGVIQSVGNFTQDKRSGLWKFNHANGQPRMEVEFNQAGIKLLFLNDDTGNVLIKDGNGRWYEEYEDYEVHGKIIVTGEMKNYTKQGEWVCKLSDGTIIYTEEFNNGKFVRGVEYKHGKNRKVNSPHSNQLILPYKFFITEQFIATPSVDFKTYPLLGLMVKDGKKLYRNSRTGEAEERVVALAEDGAMIDGMNGFYKFVGNEMQYPAEARKAGVQGKVYVQFFIELDGSVSDIQAIESPHPALSEEAIRVVKAYSTKHKLKPAKVDGKQVRKSMVMPIVFETNQQ